VPITVVILGTEPGRKRPEDAGSEPAEGSGDRPRLTFDAPRIVVGRGESCEVRLPDRSVAHRHLSLRQRGADWLIVDEGSTNGTVVDRVALAPQSPRVVSDRDRVRVGRVFLELRLGPAVPTPATAAKEAAIGLVVEALASDGEDGRPRAHVVEGPDAGKDVRIDAGRRVILGRARDADLVLEDADASRRHLEIGRRGDAVVVRDLGSRTGSAVDGKEIAGSDVVWKVGQRLTVSGNVLELEYVALEELAEIERAPDTRVPAGELAWPGVDALVDAPADAPPEALDRAEGSAEDDDDDRDDDAAAGKNRRVVRAPRRPGWNATDFAVVLLALGVLALSAVGYVVLLRR